MKQACNDAQNFNYKPTEFDAFITNEVKSYPAIIVMQRQNNGHAMTIQQLPISEHIIDQIVKEHDGHTN